MRSTQFSRYIDDLTQSIRNSRRHSHRTTISLRNVPLPGFGVLAKNTDYVRSRYILRLETVKNHLKDVHADDDLTRLVVDYYRQLWLRKRGVQDPAIYSALPLTMQAEIAHKTYETMFEQSFLFKDLSPGFLRMVALNIKPILFLKNQVIVRRGDVKRQMVYIHRGVLEVLCEEDDETPVAVLKDGKILGEVGLIIDTPSSATIRSGTDSDLCILEKTDLQDVLKYYPEIRKLMEEVCDQKMQAARKTLAQEEPGSNRLSAIYATQRRKISLFHKLEQELSPRGRMSRPRGRMSRVAPAPGVQELRRRVVEMDDHVELDELSTHQEPSTLHMPTLLQVPSTTLHRRRPTSPVRDARDDPLEPFKSLSRVDTTVRRLSCNYTQALNPTTLDKVRTRSDGLEAVSGLRQSIIPDLHAYGFLSEALHRREDPVTISVDPMMAVLLPFARETRASFTSAYTVR
ncbi:hypothetical protein NP493_872g01006 [Ridgeia piscesae]|uniref:Cyclic nucleotide-binding domain-containing protein n=1 Tax=Ridgeia piscesae TaxID=27915 RepID=A0AAD9KLQ2_RIDPI|nr:hypothetical protein NP493_872g01006 [Ridgeia piscesae]